MQTHWNQALELIGNQLTTWADALKTGAEAAHPAEEIQALNAATRQACAENPWFTPEQVHSALQGLGYMLRAEAVEQWAGMYKHLPKRYTGKRVGIIAAGNIPMVAFHDVLCAIAAGHEAVVKLSAQDRRLLPTLFSMLEKSLNMAFEIRWVDGRLPEVDAVIATGSNNTSRYFEYYFGKYPHIIRRNRNAVAILSGNEQPEHLQALGDDIFSYFGLGCRNVAKIYVHKDFNLDRLFEALYPHQEVVQHHKYANNYDYYKALWLMNGEQLLDNGFLLLRPSEALASPPGVLYYERYEQEEALRQKLKLHSEELQCVVSLKDVPFGKSQKPELWNYADGVDTMDFMLKL